MALSRLRHPLLITPASSLYNLRILSTRTFAGCSRHLLSRDSKVIDSDYVFPRPLSSFLMSKTPNEYSTRKLGLRNFSSGDIVF